MSGSNDPIKVQSSCCPSNLVTLTSASSSPSLSSSLSSSLSASSPSNTSVNTRKKRPASSPQSSSSSSAVSGNSSDKGLLQRRSARSQHMLTKADHLHHHNHQQTLLKKGAANNHRIDSESALVIPRPTPPPPLTNSSRSGNRKRTSRAYSIASLEEEEEEETEEEEEEEEEVKEEEIDEDLLLGSCLSNGGSCPATGLKVDKISEQKAKEAKAEEKEAEARGGAGTGEEEGEDMGPPSKRHKTSSPNVVVNPNSSSSPSDNTSSQPEMYSGNRISVIGQHTDNGGGGGGGLANNGGHGLSSFGLHDMNHLNQLHHHGIYGDDGAIPQLSSRGGGGNIEARFLVSSRDAGAIIGRGGNNISHLRRTYDSSITVPDCPSPERVLTIVASLDRITKIVREILQFIETRPHALGAAPGGRGGPFDLLGGGGGGMIKMNSNLKSPRFAGGSSSSAAELLLKDKSAATEIRLLLHTSHAGGLIGKGGLRITQLREETHAGIKVYSECAPQSSERVCVVYGPLDTVVYAVKEILTTITGFPLKGPNMLYDPRNYDQYLSPNYGGFSDAAAAGGVSASSGTPLGHSASSGGLSQLGMHHHSQQSSGGLGGGHHQLQQQQQQSVHLQQRNPYFQHQHPPPGLTGSSEHLMGGGSSSSSRGSNRGSNASFIPLGPSSAGSRGYGGGSNNHHHHQSGLLTPLGGRGGNMKSHHHHHHQQQQMMMMDHHHGSGGGNHFPDSADLFAPDFGGTFSSAAAVAAAAAAAASHQQGGGGGGSIQWSNARSCSSSRRSSSVSNLDHHSGGGGGGNFAPNFGASAEQEFDWLNHPDAAAKSWTSSSGLTGGGGGAMGVSSTQATVVVSSKLFQQLLATGRDDIAYGANMDGSASASISVPNKAVGAIIGRSGHRIGEIRSTSQAEISIGPNVPKTPTRLITVKGMAPSVQTAVYLICKIVDENQ